MPTPSGDRGRDRSRNEPGRPPGPRAAARAVRQGPARDSARRPAAEFPAVPEDADVRLLDRAVRAELRSLSKATAEAVGKHLVRAGELLDTNPEVALAHARAARARAGRVGAVREAVGIAAYHAGDWSEALTELRTARRISGDPRNLPVIADCERALGRPERAAQALNDPDARRVDAATRS